MRERLQSNRRQQGYHDAFCLELIYGFPGFCLHLQIHKTRLTKANVFDIYLALLALGYSQSAYLEVREYVEIARYAVKLWLQPYLGYFYVLISPLEPPSRS